MTINPYAPPIAVDAIGYDSDGRTYYVYKTAALTFGELWRLSPTTLGFVIVAGMKCTGTSLPSQNAIAADSTLRLWEDEVQPVAMQRLMPAMDANREMGFEHAFYYTVPCLGMNLICAAAETSSDRQTIAVHVYARTEVPPVIDERCQSAFLSTMHDGTLLATSNGKRELIGPSHIFAEHYFQMPTPELYARHEERLKNSTSQANRIESTDDVQAVLQKNEGENFRFHLDRGFYVEASKAELIRLAKAGADKRAMMQTVPNARPIVTFMRVLFVALGLSWLIGSRQFFDSMLLVFAVVWVIYVVSRLVRRMARRGD